MADEPADAEEYADGKEDADKPDKEDADEPHKESEDEPTDS